MGDRLRSIGRFLTSKLVWAAVTLALALTFAFILGRASGDPTVSILGPFATQEQVAELKHELGLDRPWLDQYLTYMGDTVRGDLGDSLQYARPNTELVRSRLGNSIELLFAGMLLAVLIGVPLGVLAGLREGTAWDRIASGAALVGQSIPIFWLGLILVLVFAIHLGVLPAGQDGGFEHLVLPAITLSLYPMAHISRLTRSAIAEVMHEPFIVAARARGIHSTRIVWKHALRNAAPPILTVTALQAGALLSGAVAVEYVFSWPGIGLLALDAVSFHDYTLVQAIVIVGAVTFVLITLTVDLLYGLIDPRIREGASR
jgi:peptide/nickel transport system permease protein